MAGVPGGRGAFRAAGPTEIRVAMTWRPGKAKASGAVKSVLRTGVQPGLLMPIRTSQLGWAPLG